MCISLSESMFQVGELVVGIPVVFSRGGKVFWFRFLRPFLLAVLIMHKVLPIIFIKISLSFCENSFYEDR